MKIKIPKNFFGEDIDLTVFISEEQLQSGKTGKVYGKYFESTGIFNIFPTELADRGMYLGEVYPQGSTPVEKGLCGVIQDASIVFFYDAKPIKTESYGMYQSIFSRNKGILETDIMQQKRVVILGCGSVGSLVAMELARAGVEHFVLVDPDIVEYHNICRHQCGIEDVGDLKINALTRKLKNINPKVDIKAFEGEFENLPKTTLDAFCVPQETIFVGCADNRMADVYANRISIYYQAYFISIGFWERAYAGEIFYHIPNRNMPCYECALGDGAHMSGRVEANHHVYSNQENIEGIKFEPGIYVDINYITNIGIKLIIDILNISNETYIPRLLNNLQQYTLACNTSDPQIGGDMVEIFSYPLQVTTSLAVGFGKSCQGRCKHEQRQDM